ncbi:oxygenase MpaB family protein [Streptomyces scopuliridis]|uniref:oxygenase MpaB family protein n=1 Tax=Streptomyces scopuliridis TaxID=452529 RepID=UPI00369EA145
MSETGTGATDPVPDSAPDPGLFGPRSVTWQLHSDPVMWIAGIRALCLQALHPRAVRGVTQNSDFRNDAWGRLRRTAGFVGTISYGTTEAAERAGARVRAIHRPLTAPGNLLRRIPARVRWQLPPRHILRAMARLGPDTRPAPYTLQDGTAILDGPGRAQRGDGGDSGRWRTPG